jgi:hypothetical protein
MLKGKYVLLSLAAALVCWQVAGIDTANSGIVDACKSTVSVGGAGSGVVLVCPQGDGDALNSNPGGGLANCPISLTVRDNANVGIPGIPFTDMWLVGCNDGLLLCGGSQGSNADHATGNGTDFPLGTTTFVNEPVSGGCDTGLYVVVQGVVIQNPGTCTPQCLPIAARSPDYKSSGAPGPPTCLADIRCPDSKVSNSDFSWFTGHYGTGKPYFACADYAAPLGSISLADFSKFSLHFIPLHKCPI